MGLRNWLDSLPSRKGIVGINARNLELIYPHNRRGNFPNVDDKLRCKALLERVGVPVPKTYHVIDGPKALRGWKESVEGIAAFVIKPNTGYGGNGILLVRRAETGFRSGGEEIA